jgi:hypothetical protein
VCLDVCAEISSVWVCGVSILRCRAGSSNVAVASEGVPARLGIQMRVSGSETARDKRLIVSGSPRGKRPEWPVRVVMEASVL